MKMRPNTTAKCEPRGVDRASWKQGQEAGALLGQAGDATENGTLELSSMAPRQPGVWGRGRRTFQKREQCVESKAQSMK